MLIPFKQQGITLDPLMPEETCTGEPAGQGFVSLFVFSIPICSNSNQTRRISLSQTHSVRRDSPPAQTKTSSSRAELSYISLGLIVMKITIVGSGRVGSTLAFTLALRGIGDDLVLTDARPEIAEGESLDLTHAISFTNHPMTIRAGGLSETAGSDILVLACSAPWDPAYTSRFGMGPANAKIYREIVPPLAAASPAAVLVVITNPVDVMTWHALRLSGFGARRVFGTGTLIDSARFRAELSRRMGIHPDDLRAYVLGEHGDTQFPYFSLAVAGGRRIGDDAETRELFRHTARTGYEVMRKKGHTNYAIAMTAALVIEALTWDTRRTMPVSMLIEDFQGVRDVCLSLPAVVGRGGIHRVLLPEFSPEEAKAFRVCAQVVRAGIAASEEAKA